MKSPTILQDIRVLGLSIYLKKVVLKLKITKTSSYFLAIGQLFIAYLGHFGWNFVWKSFIANEARIIKQRHISYFYSGWIFFEVEPCFTTNAQSLFALVMFPDK